MTPMQLGADAEIEILKAAVAAGVFMGAVYSLFAVVRRTLRTRTAAFVVDLFYALCFGAVFFVLSLALTDYLRMFVLAGMAAGAVMWCMTFGRLIVWAACGILDALGRRVIRPVLDKSYKVVTAAYGKFVECHTNYKNRKKMAQST